MDENKPISGELAAMLPSIAQTMDAAIRALRQSSALASVLMEKGLVTKQELDKQMSLNAHLADTLRATLVGLDKKPD